MVNRVLEKPETGSDWKKDSELTVVGERIQILFQRNKYLKTISRFGSKRAVYFIGFRLYVRKKENRDLEFYEKISALGTLDN